MKPELILHIGLWKTGTTSIQRIMAARREALAALGVHYPRAPGHANHQLLPAAFVPVERLRDFHPDTWEGMAPAARIARFHAEFGAEVAALPATTRQVVISAEQLSGLLLTTEEVAALHAMLAQRFGRIRVLAYLRRQDSHYASSYAQRLRVGDLRAPRFPHGGPAELGEYDYATILDRWACVFGEAAMEPRIYEPGSLLNGDVVDDFLAHCGIALEVPREDPLRWSNPSLAPEAIELVRAMGAHLARVPGGLDGGSPLWRRFVQAAGNVLPGHGWKPTPAEAADFLSRFGDSNEAVRRRWFPGRPVLFAGAPVADGSLPGTPPGVDAAVALEAACALILREAEGAMAREAQLQAAIARLRERVGETEGAVAAWRAVLRHDPRHPVALARLAEAALKAGDIPSAEGYLAALRAAHPEHPQSKRVARLLSAAPAALPATR